MDYEEPADVAIFDGFKDMPEEELKALYDSLGLAMTFEDFRYIQKLSWRRRQKPFHDRDSCVRYILV